MSVKIRLRRMGRKKQPHYRVVVTDSRSPRDGRFVEALGYYKPLSEPARLTLDLERVDYWLGEGAEPSNTVRSLIVRARSGGDGTVAIGEIDPEVRKAKRAEELAARRAAEHKTAESAPEVPAAESTKAEGEADAEAAVATEEAEVEEDEAAEEEQEAQADEAPASDADEAPTAEAESDEPDEEEKSE